HVSGRQRHDILLRVDGVSVAVDTATRPGNRLFVDPVTDVVYAVERPARVAADRGDRRGGAALNPLHVLAAEWPGGDRTPNLGRRPEPALFREPGHAV